MERYTFMESIDGNMYRVLKLICYISSFKDVNPGNSPLTN